MDEEHLTLEQLIQSLKNNSQFLTLLIDEIWRQMFSWSTFFESLDGYTQTLNGGSVSIDGTQIELQTGSTSGNYARLTKDPGWQGISTFYTTNMFRTAIVLGANTSQEIYIVFGDIDGKYYGFKIIDGTLYGVVNDGTTETTTNLGSVSASTTYNLEAIYYPLTKILFYVNASSVYREPAGIITSGLMNPEATVNTHIMDIKITTNEGVNKSVQLSFWQFIQSRAYNQ